MFIFLSFSREMRRARSRLRQPQAPPPRQASDGREENHGIARCTCQKYPCICLPSAASQREFRRQRAEVRTEAWRESVDDEVGALARLQSAFGIGALGGICASFLIEAVFHHEPLGDIPEKCACLAGAAVSAAKYQSLAVRSSVNC